MASLRLEEGVAAKIRRDGRATALARRIVAWVARRCDCIVEALTAEAGAAQRPGADSDLLAAAVRGLVVKVVRASFDMVMVADTSTVVGMW